MVESREDGEGAHVLDALMSEVNHVYQSLENTLTSADKNRGMAPPDLKKSTALLPQVVAFLAHIDALKERPEIATLSDGDRRLLMSVLNSRALTVSGYEEIFAKEFVKTDISNGLCQDVRNNWSAAITAADLLEDPEYEASLNSATIKKYRSMMSLPRLSYYDYFAHKYSQKVADVIIGYSTSDQKKIARHDSLVKEYNNLVSTGEFKTGDVVRIGEQVLELFEKSKE